MADLIERNAAYDAIGFERCNRSCIDCPTKCTWFFTVKNIPIAAESVKHGRWLLPPNRTAPSKVFQCSECKNITEHKYYSDSGYYKYCKDCGALMDKGK